MLMTLLYGFVYLVGISLALQFSWILIQISHDVVMAILNGIKNLFN